MGAGRGIGGGVGAAGAPPWLPACCTPSPEQTPLSRARLSALRRTVTLPPSHPATRDRASSPPRTPAPERHSALSALSPATPLPPLCSRCASRGGGGRANPELPASSSSRELPGDGERRDCAGEPGLDRGRRSQSRPPPQQPRPGNRPLLFPVSLGSSISLPFSACSPERARRGERWC